MKKLKQTKGITLVALVVTIIILLILAGISISALTNQGLFKQAQNAKNLTEEKTAEENEILTNYLEQMNAIIGGQVTESIPDGAVVTPINDITTWLKTGEISKQYSYTTIEQVIADSTCTESLMNNENAMKYLARSTEFTNAICASETTMTYLGQSAYVDDTVLNSDIWVTSISSSSYWNLVYPSVIVHSSASSTITVAGKTFTSDSSGNITHSMPWGTFSVSDSVSGQSFECTVGRDTTDVYVMPEGAIYWYGNLVKQVVSNGKFKWESDYPRYPYEQWDFYTNYMESITANTDSRATYITFEKPIVSTYTKLCMKSSFNNQSITSEELSIIGRDNYTTLYPMVGTMTDFDGSVISFYTFAMGYPIDDTTFRRIYNYNGDYTKQAAVNFKCYALWYE